MREATIIGAGIAGLTAALCLARVGFRIRLFEQAAAIQPVGAGIQLSPNALRVLARLGCLEAVRATGVAADFVTLRDGASGRPLAEVPVKARDGIGYLSVHRADLHTALMDAVAGVPSISLRAGQRLQSVTVSAEGSDLHFDGPAGPTDHHAGLLIAADGVRSAVAAAHDLPPAAPSGYAAWRIMLPAEKLSQPVSGIEAWLNRHWHAVVYPVQSGRAVNLALIARHDEQDCAPPTKAQMLTQLRGAAPLLRQIVEAGDFIGCWPMRAAPQDRPYQSAGHTAFVGDAAHAMLPFAAQGAAMGIEDAAVLAAELAGSVSTAEALARYEAARRPRIAKVLKRVRFHDFVYHLPYPLAHGRDLVMRLTPPQRLAASLDWLYGWQPPDF